MQNPAFDPNLAWLYYASGGSFIVLGVVALLLPTDRSRLAFIEHLWLMGLFGIAFGLSGFVEWQHLLVDSPHLHWILALTGIVSYVALLEFARRSLRAFSAASISPVVLYPLLSLPIAILLLASDSPVIAMINGGKLFLGLPAAFLTVYAVVLTLRSLPRTGDIRTQRPWLIAGAGAALLYGLLSVFAVHPDPALPAWLPDETTLPRALGIPVQLPMAITALLAAVTLVAIVRLSNIQYMTDLQRVLGILSGFVYRCRNDEHWTLLYLAGNVREVTGYRREELFRSESAGLDRIIHPDDRQEVWNTVQAALSNTGTFELAYRVVTGDGEVRSVQERGQAVRDTAGKVQYLQGHVMDTSELVDSQRRLERAEREAALGHWEYDGAGQGYWSTEMFRLFHVDPADGIPDAAAYLARIHPEDRDVVRLAMQDMTDDRDPVSRVYRTNPEYGPLRHLKPTWYTVRDHRGHHMRYAGTVQDVSEIQESWLALRESEQRQTELLSLARREQSRMTALLSAMSIGILFQDREQRIEYVNPAFLRMWAIDENIDLAGQPTREVLEHSTHRFARPDHASRHVLQVLDTHEISERFELDLYDGRIFTQLSYPVSEEDGRLLGRLWIYEDVTHERQTAQQLVYLAEHDALTGLYNRHRFQSHLEWMIRGARRHGRQFALLYFDLDDFKYINDSFGHRAGDTVLVRTAGEISSLVRSGEVFARLGGDEFAVLTELSRNGAEASALAERINRTVSSIPLRFRGSNLRLTTSLGITLYPLHGDNAEDLVAHADAAMYQAKNAGKNTWAIYDAERDESATVMARMTWVTRIARAIEEEAFELHFQGVYGTGERDLRHLEALVRMRDANDPQSLIMPGQFIPGAEKSGHILEIDRWVLREVITTLARHPEVSAIAVNISGRSFDEPTLAHYIEDLLTQNGVSASRLVIELTETSAVSEMQNAQRFIEAMQQLGCLVCLDDFGTGFSTFAYLKYLAVQALKIDGMFIRDLSNQHDNQAFVKAMVDVAYGLGKMTVAEFVEDEETLCLLHKLGVDMAQGYHLDRPVATHQALGNH